VTGRRSVGPGRALAAAVGAIFVLGLVVYVVWNLRRVADDKEVEELLSDEVAGALGETEVHWVGPVVRALLGILCLGLGARWLVNGSLQALA